MLDKDFFTMHYYIFKHLHENIRGDENDFEDFVKIQLNLYVNKEKVQQNWNHLKQMVQDYINGSLTFDQEPKDNFRELLIFLIYGDCLSKHNYQNELREYVRNSTKNIEKPPREIHDVTKVFVCLVLDLPTYKIQLNSIDGMEMRILRTPITKGRIFDHDVMYIFSKYDQSTIGYPDHQNQNASDCSNVSLTKEEEKEIIRTFELDMDVTKCIEFTSLTLYQPMFFKKFLFILSICSIVDIVLDLILAYKYWRSGEEDYFQLTILVLIIAGLANVVMHEYFEKKYNSLNKYFKKACNHFCFRCLFSFLQLAPFLKTWSATRLYLNRSKRVRNGQHFEVFIDNIIHGHPDYIEDNATRLNFIEMFIETRPQAILQIYIILKTQSISFWQILSIIVSTLMMIKSTLAFVAVHKRKKLQEFATKFYENFEILLLEISYFGFSLILSILLFCTIPWYYVSIWIVIRLAISFYSTDNKSHPDDHEALLFRNMKVFDLKYWTFFNYWTTVESICSRVLVFWVWLNDSSGSHLNNRYFIVLYLLDVLLFISWFRLVYKNDFIHPYSIMYITWHMKNSRIYPAQAKDRSKSCEIVIEQSSDDSRESEELLSS